MDHAYANRKRTAQAVPRKEAAPAGPSLDALRSGAAKPTAAQLGRRVDLPDAMREKMEGAFGADLSAVKLYESEAVADAGAEAVTQGANIAFAPGMLDFTSYGGQALLGHELSHVVSQARGEVTGGGFLNDRALEARADREGAMAAAGQQIAMPTAAMSSVSAAPAAGPMQASKAERKVNQYRDAQANTAVQMLKMQKSGPGYANAPEYQALQQSLAESRAKDVKWTKRLSANADLPSVGMRALDSLHTHSKRGSNDPFAYFDDADATMDILGIDKPDRAMRDRLSGETSTAIADAKSRIQEDQGLINAVHSRNTTFAGAGEFTNLPARIARNNAGINKLKQFAFRRFLDLDGDS